MGFVGPSVARGRRPLPPMIGRDELGCRPHNGTAAPIGSRHPPLPRNIPIPLLWGGARRGGGGADTELSAPDDCHSRRARVDPRRPHPPQPLSAGPVGMPLHPFRTPPRRRTAPTPAPHLRGSGTRAARPARRPLPAGAWPAGRRIGPPATAPAPEFGTAPIDCRRAGAGAQRKGAKSQSFRRDAAGAVMGERCGGGGGTRGQTGARGGGSAPHVGAAWSTGRLVQKRVQQGRRGRHDCHWMTLAERGPLLFAASHASGRQGDGASSTGTCATGVAASPPSRR